MLTDRERRIWIFLSAICVIAWCLIALSDTASSLDTDPLFDRIILALMGGGFLCIGIAAYFKRPGGQTFVLYLYCAFSCMHWGGVIGDGQGWGGLVLISVFALFASALPQSLFLHLAVSFPGYTSFRTPVLLVIYLPVLLGAVVLLLAMGGVLSINTIHLVTGVAVIFSIVGGMILLWRYLTWPQLPVLGRAVLVIAMLSGWLPHILGNLGLLGSREVQTFLLLPLIHIPLSLGWALTQRRV